MQEVVVTLLHYDIHPTLCFLSGDECELIGGRQGHVWRCGPPRELHAGQWVHSDEGIGRAQPQQSDLYPPPQPEASDGIRSASLPRWVETQDNKRHTCAYERHILEDIQGWEMTLLSPSNWKKGWPGRSSLDLVVGGLKCEMCILKKLEIQSAAQSLLSSCKWINIQSLSFDITLRFQYEIHHPSVSTRATNTPMMWSVEFCLNLHFTSILFEDENRIFYSCTRTNKLKNK